MNNLNQDSHAQGQPLPWKIFFSFALVMGFALRLIWIADMEYKGDEQWMFDKMISVQKGEPWPLLGMPSGVGTQNPGMSVWVFLVLGKIFSLTTPIALCRAVMILNSAALLILALFAWRFIRDALEKETWLWTSALIGVNPILVVLHRKIWAQSITPVFCASIAVFWMKRNQKWGAFFWGLFAAILGQIHMSGFFISFGLFLWTLLFERKNQHLIRTRWVYWLLGSLVGACGMIPWLQYVRDLMVSGQFHGQGGHALPNLRHLTYWRHVLEDSMGVTLRYSIGDAMDVFYQFPKIQGHVTYLVLVFHFLSVCAFSGIVLLLMKSRKNRISVKDFFAGTRSQTHLLVQGIFVGGGVILTAGGHWLFRHYFMTSLPVPQMVVASWGLRQPDWGRRLLLVMWLSQLFISIAFLVFVRTVPGREKGFLGQYGVPYELQSSKNP